MLPPAISRRGARPQPNMIKWFFCRTDASVLVQFDLFINTLILINKNASMRQGCLHSAHQAAFWSINI
ncbi:MAG: hypothetical protein WC091_06615, partial [Sulfuricellaceae bacterium]